MYKVVKVGVKGTNFKWSNSLYRISILIYTVSVDATVLNLACNSSERLNIYLDKSQISNLCIVVSGCVVKYPNSIYFSILFIIF